MVAQQAASNSWRNKLLYSGTFLRILLSPVSYSCVHESIMIGTFKDTRIEMIFDAEVVYLNSLHYSETYFSPE